MKSTLSSPAQAPEGYVFITAIATELNVKGKSALILVSNDHRYTINELDIMTAHAYAAFFAAHEFIFYNPTTGVFWGEN